MNVNFNNGMFHVFEKNECTQTCYKRDQHRIYFNDYNINWLAQAEQFHEWLWKVVVSPPL